MGVSVEAPLQVFFGRFGSDSGGLPGCNSGISVLQLWLWPVTLTFGPKLESSHWKFTPESLLGGSTVKPSWIHLKYVYAGRPRFGSVRLRFVHGTVRAVQVFGSDGSSGERASRYLSSVLTERQGFGSGSGSWKTVPAVPAVLSVPTKTVPIVPVPVRFLGHPEVCLHYRIGFQFIMWWRRPQW